MKALEKIIFALVLVSSSIIGCGTDLTKQDQSTTAEVDKEKNSKLAGSFLVVEGYVSPINVSINDKNYRDSEDFYTQEVVRLKAEVKKQYPDYDLFFDAEIGLKDFKRNLQAFLVSSSDTGVASESEIDSTGKFSFNLPPEIDTTVSYTLRASKRIGLRLVKDNDVVAWCYNLSAENQIALDGKPVVLKRFTTLITSYKCEEQRQNNGISLPAEENPYNYVTEAFESSATYNGYGPLPKAKTAKTATTATTTTAATATTAVKATTTTATATPSSTQTNQPVTPVGSGSQGVVVAEAVAVNRN